MRLAKDHGPAPIQCLHLATRQHFHAKGCQRALMPRRRPTTHLRPRNSRDATSPSPLRRSDRCREGFPRATRGSARHRDHLGLTKLRQLRSPNGSSPPIWWRTRARAGASATASWAARRCTAATSSGGDHPVINRSMNMGGAMVLGRGRRRESGAENDCNGNYKFCLAQHSLSPGRASRLYLAACDQHWAS
jgi:hypothetical protein